VGSPFLSFLCQGGEIYRFARNDIKTGASDISVETVLRFPRKFTCNQKEYMLKYNITIIYAGWKAQ
jgi:hypothetical protein